MTNQPAPDFPKLLEAVVWVARRRGSVRRQACMAVLFEAERLHLNLWGQPLFGETWLAAEGGPTGALLAGMLTPGGDALPRIREDELMRAVAVGRGGEGWEHQVRALREPSENAFDRCERSCLAKAFLRFSGLHAERIREIARREPAWSVPWTRARAAAPWEQAPPMALEHLVEESNSRRAAILARLADAGRGGL